MSQCPCCPGMLLRHVRTTGIYWFCPNCRQEMPVLTELKEQVDAFSYLIECQSS